MASRSPKTVTKQAKDEAKRLAKTLDAVVANSGDDDELIAANFNVYGITRGTIKAVVNVNLAIALGVLDITPEESKERLAASKNILQCVNQMQRLVAQMTPRDQLLTDDQTQDELPTTDPIEIGGQPARIALNIYRPKRA